MNYICSAQNSPILVKRFMAKQKLPNLTSPSSGLYRKSSVYYHMHWILNHMSLLQRILNSRFSEMGLIQVYWKNCEICYFWSTKFCLIWNGCILVKMLKTKAKTFNLTNPSSDCFIENLQCNTLCKGLWAVSLCTRGRVQGQKYKLILHKRQCHVKAFYRTSKFNS